uniref:Uncharacterized protein n=1 Tax=Globodera rostochiensis TaxID=31243 RepID=A0A914H678_GLORO
MAFNANGRRTNGPKFRSGQIGRLSFNVSLLPQLGLKCPVSNCWTTGKRAGQNVGNKKCAQDGLCRRKKFVAMARRPSIKRPVVRSRTSPNGGKTKKKGTNKTTKKGGEDGLARVTTIADRQLRTGQLRTTIADDNCGRQLRTRQLRTTIADKTIAGDKNGYLAQIKFVA